MKKTFYQFHIQANYIRLVCLLLITCGVYLVILSISKKNIFMGLIGIIPFPICLSAYYRIFNNRIIFTNNAIEITGNRGKDANIIQFEDKITYSDIKDMKLIYANKNSKKKGITSLNMGNLQPSSFFEFILKNEETKWVCISLFSKKQRKEMLEIINSKTGKSFDYNELEISDVSIYNFKRNNKQNKY